MGFGVWGLGFRVWGSGFGVWGLGFWEPRLWGAPAGVPVQKPVCVLSGLGHIELEFRVWGFQGLRNSPHPQP